MPSSAQNICIAGEVLDEVVRQALQLFDRVIGAGPANPFSLNNVCQTIAWLDARQHRQSRPAYTRQTCQGYCGSCGADPERRCLRDIARTNPVSRKDRPCHETQLVQSAPDGILAQ